jgi:hypothetical protein
MPMQFAHRNTAVYTPVSAILHHAGVENLGYTRNPIEKSSVAGADQRDRTAATRFKSHPKERPTFGRPPPVRPQLSQWRSARLAVRTACANRRCTRRDGYGVGFAQQTGRLSTSAAQVRETSSAG